MVRVYLDGKGNKGKHIDVKWSSIVKIYLIGWVTVAAVVFSVVFLLMILFMGMGRY